MIASLLEGNICASLLWWTPPKNEDKMKKPRETKRSILTSLTGTPDCLISILVSSLLCLMLIVTVEVIPDGQDFSLHSFTIFVNGVTWEDKSINFNDHLTPLYNSPQ